MVRELQDTVEAQAKRISTLERVAEAIEVEYAKFGHIDANVMDAMNAAGYLGEGNEHK